MPMQLFVRRAPSSNIRLNPAAGGTAPAVLGPGIFGWPYPFLLTIQPLIPSPGSPIAWSLALAMGFVPIVLIAHRLGLLVGDEALRLRAAPLLAICAVVSALGGLTVLGYVTAQLLGWPLGE
jgi:hypothetical protein